MKVIKINEIEAHLISNQAFLYKGCDSEVLNITGIEQSSNAEELILRELELIASSKFTQTQSFR